MKNDELKAYLKKHLNSQPDIYNKKDMFNYVGEKKRKTSIPYLSIGCMDFMIHSIKQNDECIKKYERSFIQYKNIFSEFFYENRDDYIRTFGWFLNDLHVKYIHDLEMHIQEIEGVYPDGISSKSELLEFIELRDELEFILMGIELMDHEKYMKYYRRIKNRIIINDDIFKQKYHHMMDSYFKRNEINWFLDRDYFPDSFWWRTLERDYLS